MVLNLLKTSRAYARFAYLEGQVMAELEPLFFSAVYPITQISSRLGGLSSDPDTEFYKHLVIFAVTASVGVAGSALYYLKHRKVKTPADVAEHAIGKTLDAASSAVNTASSTARAVTRKARELGDLMTDK